MYIRSHPLKLWVCLSSTMKSTKYKSNKHKTIYLRLFSKSSLCPLDMCWYLNPKGPWSKTRWVAACSVRSHQCTGLTWGTDSQCTAQGENEGGSWRPRRRRTPPPSGDRPVRPAFWLSVQPSAASPGCHDTPHSAHLRGKCTRTCCPCPHWGNSDPARRFYAGARRSHLPASKVSPGRRLPSSAGPQWNCPEPGRCTENHRAACRGLRWQVVASSTPASCPQIFLGSGEPCQNPEQGNIDLQIQIYNQCTGPGAPIVMDFKQMIY